MMPDERGIVATSRCWLDGSHCRPALGGARYAGGLALERLADGPHRLLALGALETVDVEDAFEVVALVLEHPGHELLPLDDDLLAVEGEELMARMLQHESDHL